MNQPAKRPRDPAQPPRRLWTDTCVYFTVMCLLALIGNFPFARSVRTCPNSLRVVLLFPFAFLLAAAARVRRNGRLSRAARAVLHPLICLGGFALCAYLPYAVERGATAARTAAILLAAAAVYAAVMGAVLLVLRRRRRRQDESAPYERQFGTGGSGR